MHGVRKRSDVILLPCVCPAFPRTFAEEMTVFSPSCILGTVVEDQLTLPVDFFLGFLVSPIAVWFHLFSRTIQF